MVSAREIEAMARAVALADRGRATVLPNPVVGCVLMNPVGQVVGEGWHQEAGLPHAEVVALEAAGAAARGSTAVVTLEPCAHSGRTGPCTTALLQAGVSRVVVGVLDPWEPAAGGAALLRAAGVDVEVGVASAAVEAVNRPWLTAIRNRRPYVTWKVASTVDGRVAAADGTSRWITGAEARADVHRLRAECDTVLVGAGTVRTDDPWLTTRDSAGVPLPRQPLRVVVDSAGRTPGTARVRDRSAPTWIATAAEVGDDGAGRVDLRRLLTELFSRERRHVLVEGGPTLAGAMVAAGLVDRVVAYIAPLLLGAGLPALGAAGVSTLDGAPRWHLADVARFGDDVRLTLEPPDARTSGPAP